MGTIIEAIKADITKVQNVEAIVNAANSSLKGGGGVDGAIHKAAGPELLKECKMIGGCSTGDAKITGAYRLPYKAIIHAVGPAWKGGKNGEAILLENCYKRTLELAEEHGIRSLAFPSIATGVYSYPLSNAAEIAVKTVKNYCDEHPDAFDYICWALLVEETRKVYEVEILSNPIKNKDAVIWGPDGDMLRAQYTINVSDQPLLPQNTDVEFAENPLQDIEFDDIVEIEFDDKVSKADQGDYAIAAASGLLSGALSIIWSKELDLEKAHSWGSDKLNQVVVKVAKTQGFKKNDLDGAIAFLEKKFPMAGDAVKDKMGGALQHHLRDFAHHPTIVGLIFSILSQFTRSGFGTDTNGKFQCIPLPEHALIGKNFEEKILFGAINWAFHLISDMSGSSFKPGKGVGIPGPILSFLKEISALPLFKSIKLNYKEAEISFSQWIAKLFNGTYFRNEDGEPIRFDLRTEIGLGAQLLDQAKPVVINECIVRMAYFFRRLTAELNEKEIESFADLEKLDPQKFMPFKNRALTRMLTVSSGVFVLVNTAGTAINAAVKSNGDKSMLAKKFFLSLNYIGIARLGIACVADAKYIAEDVREAYGRYRQHQEEERRNKETQAFVDYRFLSLDEQKMRILYSLESCIVRYDIEKTTNKKQVESKKLWLNLWEQAIGDGFSVEPDTLFIRDEELLYSYLCYEWTANDNHDWISLLGMELSQFEAYTPLDVEQDKLFKSLKCSKSYIEDVFCTKQDFISFKEVKTLEKSIKRYESLLTGKTQKALIGVAGTAVVTAATGGLALAFAPEIAVIIAGEAVAGLYGAALTSASLAFVGGGALAAGGLGMAGGVAILTGGGALIGIASSGTATLLNVLASVPENYILCECAKLLTMCKCMLSNSESGWEGNIAKIKKSIDHASTEVENDIKLAEMQTKDKNKLEIKKMRTGYKYLIKCSKELEKMLDKKLALNE